MAASESRGNAAALVQLAEANLRGVVDLRGHALEHAEEAVAWRDLRIGSGVHLLESRGLLRARTARERLALHADGVAIHPPQAFAELCLLVFRPGCENGSHMPVDQRLFRAR